MKMMQENQLMTDPTEMEEAEHPISGTWTELSLKTPRVGLQAGGRVHSARDARALLIHNVAVMRPGTAVSRERKGTRLQY